MTKENWTTLIKTAGGQVIKKANQIKQADIIIDTVESFSKTFKKDKSQNSKQEFLSKHYETDLILNGIL